MYIYLIIAGFFGGVVRGLVGWLKHQFSYKNVPFNLPYFLAISFISGIIGLVGALAVKELGFEVSGSFTPALSFIIGYAGGDFLEGIYKVLIKNSSLKGDVEKKGKN